MPQHHSITESELQVAERLVRETNGDIARQKRIIEELCHDGRPAIGAATLLGLLEKSLKAAVRVRDTLRRRA